MMPSGGTEGINPTASGSTGVARIERPVRRNVSCQVDSTHKTSNKLLVPEGLELRV